MSGRGRKALAAKTGRRTFFRRRKVCKFTAEGIEYIDYKDVNLLRGFVPERAKVLPLGGSPATRRAISACWRRRSSARATSRCCPTSPTEAAMKVILLSDLHKVGHRGDVITAKPGYARNYLIPEGLAVQATHGNLKWFEAQRKKIDERSAHERQSATEVATRDGRHRDLGAQACRREPDALRFGDRHLRPPPRSPSGLRGGPPAHRSRRRYQDPRRARGADPAALGRRRRRQGDGGRRDRPAAGA